MLRIRNFYHLLTNTWMKWCMIAVSQRPRDGFGVVQQYVKHWGGFFAHFVRAFRLLHSNAFDKFIISYIISVFLLHLSRELAKVLPNFSQFAKQHDIASLISIKTSFGSHAK